MMRRRRWPAEAGKVLQEAQRQCKYVRQQAITSSTINLFPLFHELLCTVSFKTFETSEVSCSPRKFIDLRSECSQKEARSNKKKAERVKETQKEITDIYSEFSYEELTNVLNEWLNPDDETSSEKKEEKPVNEFDKKLAEDNAKKESASKVQDASQQFDDLFNN